jgi:hypothetical protein
MRPHSSCRSALAALACAAACALAPGDAGAVPVAFGDSVHYWPGYANGSGDDARDTIGTPDLRGGVANLAGGVLTSVSIDYVGPFSIVASGRGSVIPGDLFIDAGADGDWDFIVKLVSGPQTRITETSALQILDVRGESEAYLWSGSDNTGHFRGFNVRDQHPYAWAGGGAVVGTASLTAPSLLDNGLQTLVIAFGPSCANDVLFERISAPVPEPGAALVFAAGLALVARRRSRP